jgi:hypothetical protein
MWIQPDIPSLRSLPKRIDASCFNQVSLALRRIGKPLRLGLPQHNGLEMVLDEDGWLCVDAARNDLPVLAWHTFEVHGRGTLHEPIGCRLELYHIHAGLVMGTVLDALQEALKKRLGDGSLPVAGIHRLM